MNSMFDKPEKLKYTWDNVKSHLYYKSRLSEYREYIVNNWLSFTNRDVSNILDDIAKKGMSLWINAEGALCYRFTWDGEIHVSTMSKVSIVLTNFLGEEIKIGSKSFHSESDRGSARYLSIKDLFLIEHEEFNPYKDEFYLNENKRMCRNTFIPPSTYLKRKFLYSSNLEESFICEYIYFLSNYDMDRFYYIMNWLASFFQTLNTKGSAILVLIGKENSGLDILYNEVIKPLFGSHNCIQINDEKLKVMNKVEMVEKKLFYNLDGISNMMIEDKKIKIFLEKFLNNTSKIIELVTKDSIIEIPKFGQTLITAKEAFLPYIDTNKGNYTVLKVPDNIEDYFHKVTCSEGKKINKLNVIILIKMDLNNFENILKKYNIRDNPSDKFLDNDDKGLLFSSLDDKLKAFSNAIVNKNIEYFDNIQKGNPPLFKDIIKDFEKNRIKQPNLLKCFNSIYKEENITSSKTLMTKLRTLNTVFNIDAIKAGGHGIKYFYL